MESVFKPHNLNELACHPNLGIPGIIIGSLNGIGNEYEVQPAICVWVSYVVMATHYLQRGNQTGLPVNNWVWRELFPIISDLCWEDDMPLPKIGDHCLHFPQLWVNKKGAVALGHLWWRNFLKSSYSTRTLHRTEGSKKFQPLVYMWSKPTPSFSYVGALLLKIRAFFWAPFPFFALRYCGWCNVKSRRSWVLY